MGVDGVPLRLGLSGNIDKDVRHQRAQHLIEVASPNGDPALQGRTEETRRHGMVAMGIEKEGGIHEIGAHPLDYFAQPGDPAVPDFEFRLCPWTSSPPAPSVGCGSQP